MNRITLLFSLLFVSLTSFAQNPKAVEAELLKSFKQIDTWHWRLGEDNGYPYDSLVKANESFIGKLKQAASQPGTITMPFSSLKKQRLDIFTSDDGLFRIYSWNTWQGGSKLSVFNDVFQYKNGAKWSAVLDTALKAEAPAFLYLNLYTFKANQKTYYLAVYISSVLDDYSITTNQGIRVFAIENGKLNSDVKIIKTWEGLQDRLSYEFDPASVIDWKENGKVVNWKERPRPKFNPLTQTITLPNVDDKMQVTRRFISYKFNGKYFELVKS